MYSTVRPYLKNIAVVEKDYVPRAIASTAFAVMHPHTGLRSEYLLLYLRSAAFTDFVSSKAVGIAYPAINDANFFQGVIAVPPSAEQSRIVTRVEELMRLCDALEGKGRLEGAQHRQLVTTLLGTLTDSTSPEALTDRWQRIAAHFDILLDRPEAVDALEQTIVQLAVRGLLVPQDLTNEPAIALLRRMRAEKDELIAKGKVKRYKPASIRGGESRLFEVPAGWEWTQLIAIATSGPANGLSPRPSELPTVFRCLTLSSTTKGYFKSDCFKYVDISTAAAQTCCLKRGDLLIQRGNSLDYVGIAALYDGADDEFIYPDLMMRLRLSQHVVPEYVHAYLISSEARAYFKRNATGTQGTMRKVNQATVAQTPIPLPPLDEQSRIVARVEELRRLCANLRERLVAGQATRARLAEALAAQTAP
ncbi:MAG: restriction endonuclease subunit S [Comamonadaceae bacterium]|nr:MAG: restriction endonuclease subunit S [Comamonadaceae bacterium]